MSRQDRIRKRVVNAWARKSALDTVMYNEIQALRNSGLGSERDNALLEAITTARRVIQKYERLMGIRLWAGKNPQ